MKNPKRIIGIGASAGGLKAITEFFDHIPPDTDMSFVVIQHLSPDFKSMMSELLQKHTKMEITVVDKPTAIKPNQIFLISSQFNVVLEKNMLKPVERSDPKTLNLPIDLFFHSLSEEAKENAVGIILSGTGSDGSKGVRAIEKAGGLVMVEDPHHAQFDGMPLAALTTGDVDFVLPPYALARELLRINTGKKIKKSDFLIIDPQHPDFPALFDNIITEIFIETGINFRNYRHSTLIRRMEKRMFITKQYNLGSYLKYLKRDPEEVTILQEEFLINVTHFFRDTEAFEVLNKKVIATFVERKKPNEQIRIWVPACSTGQEAISLAILLKEYLNENGLTNPFKIFASDVDKNVISAASEGIYSSSTLAEMPVHYLSKYFEPTNPEKSKYAITKSLRETIVYAVHDALFDPPFINLDLISCRNMMIYLNVKNQQTLINNFHFALNYEGHLFLGPSESLGELKRMFTPVSTKWNIFQNTSEGKLNQVQFAAKHEMKIDPGIYRKPAQIAVSVNRFDRPLLNEKTYVKLLIEQFAPTCVLINEQLDILLTNGSVDKILGFPRVSGRFNIEEMVGTDELIFFKNGIRKCQDNKRINFYENIKIKKSSEEINLDIQFRSLRPKADEKEIYLIEFFFNKVRQQESASDREVVLQDELRAEKISTIQKELQQVQLEKRMLIQELEMANEELQASNEELLAANEELQSTNEELQSVNEELYTVNTELQNKVNQLITTTNDLDNLLNSTEIGSIFLDQKLNIRRFTPAIVNQFALLESDIGRSITSFTNTFDDKNIYAEIQNVVNKLVTFEKKIKDEKDNNYLMRVLPYRTDEGQIDGAVLTFIPINELKKAHDNLEEIAERYRAVFDNSYDGIMLIDKEGIVSSSNKPFLNFSKEQIINRSIFDIMINPYQDVLKSAIDEVIEGAPSSYFHFDYKENEGKQSWFSATITPVLIKNDIQCLALITRDITELKEKELELREAGVSLEKQVISRSEELEIRNTELKEINSYLDSFVHGAAHDLRSPITQINGMLQLFPKIDDPAKREIVFQEISVCVKRLEKTLTGLIEMIDFQKNNNRTSQQINLHESFTDVIEQLDYELKYTDYELNVDIDPALSISFIRAYITSIFYNLMSNAVKYRSFERKLEINISVKHKGEFFVISVSDNGIGIDLNRYGHFLFQPFKRLTVEREGTGIGLSIINNLVRKSGGNIEVESKLGQGTTFKVYVKPLETGIYEQPLSQK